MATSNRTRAPAVRVAVVVGAVVWVAGMPTASAGTIDVNCANQNLQSKMTSAAPGSTLLIKGTCVGNFVLNKGLTLKGSPEATLDGDQTGSTLRITGSPTVHLVNLTITRGLATKGGGINAQGGTLTLSHVVVQDSYAVADKAQGGGIYKKSGSLTITESQVVHDVADTLSHDPITDSQGGGIFMLAGALTISGSTIAHDQAICRTAGQCQAIGGGIDYEGTTTATHITNSHVDDDRVIATGNIAVVAGGGASLLASFSITRSTMKGNLAQGTGSGTDSQGVAVGAALAGAGPTVHGSISSSVISGNQTSLASTGSGATANAAAAVDFGGNLTVTSSQISGNRTSVDSAGSATVSGGGLGVGGHVTLTHSSVSSNVLTVHSGTGGATATGGGIDGTSATSLTIVGSTVSGNHVSATSQSADASATAGGVVGPPKSFVMHSSTVSGNTATATASGANTASAHAGGIELIGSSAKDSIVNSTIAGNAVNSHASNAFAAGGGIESIAGTLTVTNATIARNQAGERGGGLLVGGGTTTLEATILALNSAPSASGPNCRGTVHSAGHNLLGTTAGCTFNAQGTTDKLNKDPKLGQLKPNGGPTETMALLAGSPALNAIPKAACAVSVDQRGVPRPQGPGCDIGAFELKT